MVVVVWARFVVMGGTACMARSLFACSLPCDGALPFNENFLRGSGSASFTLGDLSCLARVLFVFSAQGPLLNFGRLFPFGPLFDDWVPSWQLARFLSMGDQNCRCLAYLARFSFFDENLRVMARLGVLNASSVLRLAFEH